MADLGSINTINPNAGTRPVDTRTLEQGIKGALGLVEQVHTQNVVDDVAQQVKADLSTAAAELNQGDTVDSIDVDLTREENDLRVEILDLQHDIRNGNSSLKARAQLKINQTLEQARINHPRLAGVIQAEISSQVSVSSDLTELGLADTLRDAAGTAAQAQLDAYMDRATKLISANGLGMKSTTDLTNPKDLREFVRRDTQRSRIEAGKLRYGVAKADASMSNFEKADAAISVVVGKDSAIHLVLGEHNTLARAYFAELQKPTAQIDPQVINAFAAQKDDMILTDQMMISQLDQELLDLGQDPKFRAGPEFADLALVLEDRKALIQRQITMLQGVVSTTFAAVSGAALKSEVYETARSNKPLETALRILNADEEGGLLRLLELGVTRGGITGENLAEIAEEALAGMAGIVIKNSGGDKLNPDSTPAEIDNRVRVEQQQGSTPFGRDDQTEEEQIVEALSQQAMVQASFAAMERLPAAATPENAGRLLTTSTYGLALMNALGNPAVNQVEMTLSAIASPQFVTGITAVGDMEYVGTRLAWADEAQDFIANPNGPIAQDRVRLFAKWQGNYRGVQFKDVVQVNLDGLKTDRIVGSVLSSKIEDVLYNEFSGRPLPSGIQAMPQAEWAKLNAGRIKREVKNVTAQFASFLKAANLDIRSSAHVSYAGGASVSGEATPSYGLWADRLGYLDLFGQ